MATPPITQPPAAPPQTPIQEWAQREETQAKQPGLAAMYKYQHPYQAQNSMSYQAGGWLRGKMLNGSGLARPLNAGTVPGFLAGAIPGAVGAGLGAMALGRATGSDVSPWMWALLGGLGLGAAGAYSGYTRTHKPAPPLVSVPGEAKAASWKLASLFKLDGDPKGVVMAALQAAPGMSFSERANLMAGVGRLSDMDAEQLKRMIALAGGVGAGAIIARFLVGKGLASTLLGAVFGGVVANAIFNQPARNSAGLLSLGNKDWYGNTTL